MFKLVYYELKKAFALRAVPTLLLLLLAVNGFTVYYTAVHPVEKEYTYTLMDISAVFADHQGQDIQDFYDELSGWDDLRASLYRIDDESGQLILPTQEETAALLTYTDDLASESRLFAAVLTRLDPLLNYVEYLDGIDTDAERMTKSSLFAQPGTFAYRNLISTPDIYAAVHGTQLTADDSSGVTCALDSQITTVFMLFAMMIVVMALCLSEWDSGAVSLIHPMKNGYSRTIAAKLTALDIMIFLITLLFFGVNLSITGALFGLGNMNRSIQSLYGYITSPLVLTVGQYLVCFLAAKYLAVLVIGLLFFLICLSMKRLASACLITAGMMLAELTLYLNIDIHSWLSPLRQLNLVSILDTISFFNDYNAMNFFTWPVNQITAAVAMAAVVSIAAMALSVLRWNRAEIVDTVRIRKSRRKWDVSDKTCVSLFCHELFKLFVTRRGSIILACLLAFQIYSASNVTAYVTDDEYYYQQYAAALAGELTGEKEEYIIREQDSFKSIQEEMDEIEIGMATGEISVEYGSYLAGKLKNQLEPEKALARAAEQYTYLQEQEALGYDVEFVMDSGYTALLEDWNMSVIGTGLLCFVLALGLAGFWAMEESSSVRILINTSLKGRGSVLCVKLLSACIFSALAWLAAFLPRIISLCHIYGLDEWMIGARSLTQFQYAPDWSLAAWFGLWFAIRLAVALLTTVGIVFLSYKMKKEISAFCVSLLILEFPVCLYFLGIDFQCLLLPLLTGRWMISA